DLRFIFPLWYLGVKLIILIVAIPVLALLELTRNAVKARKDPFCIHCGYGLSGLPDYHNCPECGRPYTFAHVEEYRRDRNWFIKRKSRRPWMPRAEAPFMAGRVKSRKSRDGT